MDINQILPLLMNNGDDNTQQKLISAMLKGGGSNEELLSAMMGGKDNSSDPLAAAAQNMAGGSNMDMMKLMNMLSKKNQPSVKIEGLTVISNIAPPDILGTMYKILSLA